MAKYAQVNEPVFISKTKEFRSPRYGNMIWEVDLVGCKTQRHYKTYADPTNVNWSIWELIIELAQFRGVVLTNCKFKDEEKGLINADSQVKVQYAVTKQELADILSDFWAKDSKFNELFGS